MQMQESTIPRPPGLVATLAKGFDTIANNIAIIILPVLLDLFLWLGPKLRLKTLLAPLLDQMTASALPLAESLPDAASMQQLWDEFLTGFNLLGALRTFPLGVVSLMSSRLPSKSPLGQPASLEISSYTTLISGWMGLVLLGWLLGCVFYTWIARVTATLEEKPSFTHNLMQSMWISLIWVGLALLVGTPLLLLLSIVLALSPAIAQGAMFVLMLIGVWLLMPVFFSPHGIFVYGNNAIASIMKSLKLIRFTLPSSGTFLLVCLLINEGLGYLWAVPPQDSWLNLVAIVGHGFVSTALIASTFIYYREVNIWLKIVMEKLQALQKPAQPEG
jgi:hypothetical protein